MSYIKDYLETLTLPARTDCPSCHNTNTFVANLVDGQILYYCFHANCNLKGKIAYARQVEDIRNFTPNSDSGGLDRVDGGGGISQFIIPNHWQNPLQNRRCLSFLGYWKILDIYTKRLVDIYYDPKLERCVFILKDPQGAVKGAIGRALHWETFPKWYVYARIDHCPGLIFTVGKGLILVEDFISACRVSTIINSCAILGTSLPNEAIKYIKQHTIVFIALDKDATSKSLKIQQQVAPYITAKIIPLEADIKYYNNKKLEELQNEISQYL